MSLWVCGGATMTCTFGTAPSMLNVLPQNRTSVSAPLANIMDNKPLVNILPFALCQSPSNPAVTAATAAALGVLTPMPCVPVVEAPWVPGSPTVMLADQPALSDNCQCICTWGGVIRFSFAGQATILLP